jgi:hypothetical protein
MRLKSLRSDSRELIKMKNEIEAERDVANKQVDALKQSVDALEHAERELEQEKRVTKDLRAQIIQAREEMPRFDLDPQAYRTITKDPDVKPKMEKGTGPRNLEKELEFEEKPSRGEEESSSSSSDDEDDRKPDPTRFIAKVVRIFRLVRYDDFLPIPLILAWVNGLIICIGWICEAYHRVAPLVRRLLRLPSSGSPRPPSPPHSPTGSGDGGDGPPTPPRDDSGKSTPKGDGKDPASIEEQFGFRPPGSEGSDPKTPPGSDPRPPSRSDSGSSANSGGWVSEFQQPPKDGDGLDTSSIYSAMASVGGGGKGKGRQDPDKDGSQDGGDGRVTPPRPDLSKFLDPIRPRKDRREKFEIASQDGGDEAGDGAMTPRPESVVHTHGAPPGVSTFRILTAEEAKRLYPEGEGEEEGGVDNIIYNTPNFPVEQSIWERIANPDPRNRPDAVKTFTNIFLQLIFFFCCYMMWVIWQERQNWVEANNVARSFFDDLFQHRNQYRRGITAKIFTENWASGFERIFLWIAELFGAELRAYPIPG